VVSTGLGDSWSVISTGSSINARARAIRLHQTDRPKAFCHLPPAPTPTICPVFAAALYLISNCCPLQHRHSCEPSCPPAVSPSSLIRYRLCLVPDALT
jgi:hypothetical protein